MSNLLSQTLLSLTVFASLVASAPYQPINGRNMPAPQCPGGAKVGKAVYFITNDKENAVVALPIAADGTLSAGTVTKTGGAGSIAVDAATGEPATPDALISQSALTVAGNNIFAVNAGSNTLTMLTIDPADPTCVTVVGQPVTLPGEFPNTVAASTKNKLACVGMTGAKAGVSCASFSAKGLGKMDALRTFELGQTTPPKGPLNTVSHSFFSNDESTLFTTVKGNPMVNNTGFLSSFKVDKSRGRMAMLSTTGIRSSPMGTAVLFGSAPIPHMPNMLFVTDASFGGAVLSIDQMSQATVKGKQAIEGQRATCWATISKETKSAYVTDVAVNRMVEMSLEDASIIAQLDLSANGDRGLIDLRSAGSFVYALSPGNATTKAAITVLDVSGGQGSMKQAQHFSLDGIAGSTAMGMAVL